MSIEEGNRIIAEFMGYIPRNDISISGALFMQAPLSGEANVSGCYIVDKALDKYDEFIELQYHTSWAWLMPVVDKIDYVRFEILSFTLENGKYSVRITERGMNGYRGEKSNISKIKATYQAVIEFIKWFNTNPRQDGAEK